jgi:hypothetical protein
VVETLFRGANMDGRYFCDIGVGGVAASNWSLGKECKQSCILPGGWGLCKGGQLGKVRTYSPPLCILGVHRALVIATLEASASLLFSSGLGSYSKGTISISSEL